MYKDFIQKVSEEYIGRLDFQIAKNQLNTFDEMKNTVRKMFEEIYAEAYESGVNDGITQTMERYETREVADD